MPDFRHGLADFSEIRFRIQSIEAGIKLTLVICAGGWGYVVATLGQPSRGLIASMFGIGAVVALFFVLLPHERIVRGRWREPFFVLWSAFNIALAGAVVVADGGATSPFSLLFFVPLVFAALSYPLSSVVAIGALDYIAYVAVGVSGERPDPEYVGFFALCLAATAVICAWHARHQDRRREELARVSRADPLTGCLNRRGFEERFESELSRVARSGRPLGLILLDLDRFKQINDSWGHAAGDALLCWVVDTAQEIVRPVDAVGRLGGDEFAILVPGAGRQDTATVAHRLRKALAERAPASAGVACFPADGADRDELQRHADDELFTGKQGRPTDLKTGKELSWATALARAVDERMVVQHDHSRKVADYSVAMARKLGWPENEVQLLEMAAMLHDVGKVSVPDSILLKKDPLTAEEWEELKKHPLTGSELVARIDGLEPIVPWILHSHEHFDGSGYPDGLSREAIPLACRILHVADAFDAMTSNRPYRPALTAERALAELHRKAGAQFDPGCVALFEEHCEPLSEAPSDSDAPTVDVDLSLDPEGRRVIGTM
jgi:diguanylate cyclase (GGDEF)-like protein